MRTLAFSLPALFVLLAACAMGQSGSFRYFYDDANELFRVLDSSGTLVEYIYDASGNIVQTNRSTVAPSSLSILNITPLSGPFGQTVTIYGQNFSSTAANNLVQFGGVMATVVSASPTALVVQLPAAFTNGQVSVTVNGVTANSGTLAFTPPPSITSISPPYGTVGQTLSGVTVQGANLTGASFALPGGGTVTTVNVSSTQATVNLALGQTPGTFALVATTNSGSSNATLNTGDFFVVYNASGNNFTDATFSTFNASGNTPLFPAGTNKLDTLFSVFNATGTTPRFPAGTNLLDSLFSVFNATGGTPDFPPGTNITDLLFSVFNATGATPRYPAGSNESWQLFSTMNTQNGASTSSLTLAVARAPRRPGSSEPPQAAGGRSQIEMLAGQSVEVALVPSMFAHFVELDANGVSVASSTTSALRTTLTAPFGVDSFDLKGIAYPNVGPVSDTLAETVHVAPDPGRSVTGRVVDADGAPVTGAVVTWQAQGLAAEYYRFGAELRAMPELTAGPARLSFLGALNYPNPKQVFGTDPMGVGLGPHYAARLAGNLQVDAAGLYQFELLAHLGARLTIDGQLVAAASATGADAGVAQGSVRLSAGAHKIEVTHFESAGAAALQLLWTPPDGVQTVVPPQAISAEAPAVWRAVTGSDGRFVLHVPAALDGVVVKLAMGAGSVQLDR